MLDIFLKTFLKGLAYTFSIIIGITLLFLVIELFFILEFDSAQVLWNFSAY